MGPVSRIKRSALQRGGEIMYAEFTGAVGCCCCRAGERAGGWTSLEQNDSCIEMRRLQPSPECVRPLEMGD